MHPLYDILNISRMSTLISYTQYRSLQKSLLEWVAIFSSITIRGGTFDKLIRIIIIH